jgi:hypothetical protein
MTTSVRSGSGPAAPARRRSILFSAFAGLTALAVLLQGLWAGLFVPAGKGGAYRDTWVHVHGYGADVAILLALITTIVGFVRLRAHRQLWLGAAALTLLLVLEAYLGELISDGGTTAAAAVHIPLALAIMALTVWLPLRARQIGHARP